MPANFAGVEKKAGSEHRRLCLCVGAVRCGLSWATPEGSPVSHSGSVKKPDRRLMHYLQLDPSRSNLPKDSTGRIKGGPGRKKGAPNVLSRLSRTASLEFSRSSGASKDVRLGQEGPQERICLLRSHMAQVARGRDGGRGGREVGSEACDHPHCECNHRSEGRLPGQGLAVPGWLHPRQLEGDMRMARKTEYERLVEQFEGKGGLPTLEEAARLFEERGSTQPARGQTTTGASPFSPAMTSR